MSETSEPWPAAVRDWWGYERPPTYDVVGTTVEIRVRDGVTIAAELRRPARDGVPVDGPLPGLVVEFTPYVVLREFYLGEADFFAARGYNALVGIFRGVGGSTGEWSFGSFRQGGEDGAFGTVRRELAAQLCREARSQLQPHRRIGTEP